MDYSELDFDIFQEFSNTPKNDSHKRKINITPSNDEKRKKNELTNIQMRNDDEYNDGFFSKTDNQNVYQTEFFDTNKFDSNQYENQFDTNQYEINQFEFLNNMDIFQDNSKDEEEIRNEGIKQNDILYDIFEDSDKQFLDTNNNSYNINNISNNQLNNLFYSSNFNGNTPNNYQESTIYNNYTFINNFCPGNNNNATNQENNLTNVKNELIGILPPKNEQVNDKPTKTCNTHKIKIIKVVHKDVN